MNYGKFRNRSVAGRVYRATILPRGKIKLRRIRPWISSGKRILEVGSGNCGVAHLLKKEGFSVDGLDIRDLSFFDDVTPELYKPGEPFPFDTKSFDVCTVLTMLHHTRDHRHILSEACRTADEVIVMEDVYKGWLMKKLTHWMDSLVNLEFKGHPHSNRTESEWERLFEELGLTIIDRRRDRVLFIFRQTTWRLKVTAY